MEDAESTSRSKSGTAMPPTKVVTAGYGSTAWAAVLSRLEKTHHSLYPSPCGSIHVGDVVIDETNGLRGLDDTLELLAHFRGQAWDCQTWQGQLANNLRASVTPCIFRPECNGSQFQLFHRLTTERAIMFRHVRCVAYSVMFLAICLPAACAGQDWPRFRGPGGMGISDATDLPIEWGQSHGLVWKTALPGAGASSPITFGDRIFLTCYTGFFVPGESGGSPEQLQRHLIALRLDDGQVVWDKAVAAKLPEEEQIRDHGFAANSVAVGRRAAILREP